jgi:hypothetical protein
VSGQLFDFWALGLLDLNPKFARHSLHAVAAVPNVKLFAFPKSEMPTIVSSHPSTRLLWKELLMENMLKIMQCWFFDQQMQPNTKKMISHPPMCTLFLMH